MAHLKTYLWALARNPRRNNARFAEVASQLANHAWGTGPVANTIRRLDPRWPT